jgi:hypothetical protein
VGLQNPEELIIASAYLDLLVPITVGLAKFVHPNCTLKLMRLITLTLLCFSWSLGATALELPTAIHDFLTSRGYQHLLDQWSQIPEISPQKFLLDLKEASEVSGGAPNFAGMGYEGTVFRIANHPFAWKFSTHLLGLRFPNIPHYPTDQVFSPQEIDDARATWKPFLESELMQVAHTHREKTDQKIRRSRISSNLGSILIWNAFSNRSDPLPEAVTSDGLAVKIPWVEGVTMDSFLKADAEASRGRWTTPNLVRKIWDQYVTLERINVQMMLETGVYFDICNPGNIIIEGLPDKPNLVVIDSGLGRPSPESVNYYNSKGIGIKVNQSLSQLTAFAVPYMPGWATTQPQFTRTVEQARDYLRAVLGQPTNSRIDKSALPAFFFWRQELSVLEPSGLRAMVSRIKDRLETLGPAELCGVYFDRLTRPLARILRGSN